MRYAIALLCFASWTTSAQTVSTAPDSVEVVIYREDGEAPQPYEGGIRGGKRDPMPGQEQFGLAMVSEQRTVQLPAGRSVIRFESVADLIIPQTAKLQGLPTPVVEGNFDYDLLSPGSIIAKSIGLPVRIVRTNRQTGVVTEQRAILRAGPQGVMLDTDTGAEALGCSGLDERLVFETIPTSLADRPTLSMAVNVPQAGRYALRLSYLTLGLSWTANYVAKLNGDSKTLDLIGWITLTNRSASTFRDAPIKVVAGNLSRDKEATVPPSPTTRGQSSQCWPVGDFATYRRTQFEFAQASVPMAMSANLRTLSKDLENVIVTGSRVTEQSELGDYKLYTLPEKTTVAAQQTKQIKMLEKRKVTYERFYQFTYDPHAAADEPAIPSTYLRLRNRANTGLGLPLPAGTVSVMEPNGAGRLILAGEDSSRDVPVGLAMELELGEAMDLHLRPRVVKDEVSANMHRREIEISIANDKSVPTRLELAHQTYGEADFRMINESAGHTLKSGYPVWTVNVPAGGRQVLRYTIESPN